MDFNDVSVVQHVVAFDRGSVVHVAAPDARELEVLSKVFVDQSC